MADNLQLAWNATTLVATVQAKGDALPAGSVKIGTFGHNVSTDNLGDNPSGSPKLAESHVLYQHVRDLLYTVGQLDMQSVTIQNDTDYVALTAFTIVESPTTTVAIAGTRQLTHTFTPSNASNKKLTYSSATPAKATVSATGLITGVAAGTSVITVTSDDGAIVRTTTVTVS